MTSLQDARPAVSARSTVRQLLRAATADLHAAVDARFSADFDSGGAAYGRFLTALGSVVPPLEAALEAAGVERLLQDWQRRRRSPFLQWDLRTLGLAVPAPLPVVPPRGEAGLFGMLYVLEGSRLGGKLLLRRALASPEPRVRAATRYLGHGDGGELWRAFVERLEASAAVACSPDAAIAGAREAFALFAPGASHG
jgi:heme oxygenase